MKLIMENWRKYLNEAWEDESSKKAFGEDPDDAGNLKSPFQKTTNCWDILSTVEALAIKHLKGTLPPQDRSKVPDTEREFLKCMKRSGFEKIGAGHSRYVFDIKGRPEFVLKVAKVLIHEGGREKSKKMNEKEANARYQTSSDLAVPVYETADDFSWIIQKKVNTISGYEQMQKFYPVWMKYVNEGYLQSSDFDLFHKPLIKKCIDDRAFDDNPDHHHTVAGKSITKEKKPEGYSSDWAKQQFKQLPKFRSKKKQLALDKEQPWLSFGKKSEVEESEEDKKISGCGEEGKSAMHLLRHLMQSRLAKYYWDKGEDPDKQDTKLSDKILADLLSSPESMFAKVRHYLAAHKLPSWDIEPKNVGYIEKEGEKQYVVLDPGFELK